MNIEKVLERLPNDKGAVVLLSGGMDSTVALRLAVEKYQAENVAALSFYYGQRQTYELECAQKVCGMLNVSHKIADIPFLRECSMGISANVDQSIDMPSIQDVLGDPAPKTEVPNRNAIMLHLAAAYSQSKSLYTIICGLQTNDVYSFGDCSQEFVDSINRTLEIKNRKITQRVISPFCDLSKTDEIKLIQQLNGLNLLRFTMTCYNPQLTGLQWLSCKKCPSCAERLRAFKNVGIEDPVLYVFD